MILSAGLSVQHVMFFRLEAFLWTSSIGQKTFRHQSKEYAISSMGLAANQGFYNLLLAFALVFGMISSSGEIIALISGLIACAGLYGAITVSKQILFVQCIPALANYVLCVLFAFELEFKKYIGGLVGGLVITWILGNKLKQLVKSVKSRANAENSKSKE
jgi:putative membrane protein